MQVGKTLTYIKTNKEEEEEKGGGGGAKKQQQQCQGIPSPGQQITSEGGLGRDGTSVFWAFCWPDTLSLTFRGKDNSRTHQPASGQRVKGLESLQKENRRPQDGVLLQSGPIGSTEVGRDVERAAQKRNK